MCQRQLTVLSSPGCFLTRARSLEGNDLGGYYDEDDEFFATTEGIIALCEGLKGSAVTSLECAAAPKCLPFSQRPLTRKQTPTSSSCTSLTSPATVTHSVGWNGITGDTADQLANVVLEHASMTDFCGIPLVSLRENSITELNLECKGVGVPGAIVLSTLLPSAVALTSLKCAATMQSVL